MKWTLDSNGVQATKSPHCHQLRDQSRKTRQGITWSSHTWTNTKTFWWAFLLQAGPIQTILDHAIRLIFLNKTCKNKTSPALIPHFCGIYPCYPLVPSLPFQPDLPQLTTSCVYTSHAPGHICIHCLPIQPSRHNLTAHFQVCSTLQPMKASGKSKKMKRLGKHCISSLTFGKLLCNCYNLNQALPECKVHAVHHYFVHHLYTYKVIVYDTDPAIALPFPSPPSPLHMVPTYPVSLPHAHSSWAPAQTPASPLWAMLSTHGLRYTINFFTCFTSLPLCVATKRQKYILGFSFMSHNSLTKQIFMNWWAH